MAHRHDRSSRSPAMLAFGLALAGCAGGPTASAPASAMLRLAQSGAFSQPLGLAGGDAIVALGRIDATHVAASTKSGKAFDLDLDAGAVDAIAPWFQFDGSNTSVFTVSKDYTWVLYVSDGMIGRNSEPPDATNKFDISKAPVSDLISNVAKLNPIAATPQQAFFVTSDSLIVFTFDGNSIGRKKLPLPGGSLGQNELPLGAGSIDDPTKGYGEWLATNRRLLRYLETASTWTMEPLELKTGNSDPSLLSLELTGKTGAKAAGTVGLFGGSTVTSLDSPSSSSADASPPPAVGAGSESSGT